MKECFTYGSVRGVARKGGPYRDRDICYFRQPANGFGFLLIVRIANIRLDPSSSSVAREQLKQVVTNRVSQFFTADSFKVEGSDPLMVTFLYAPRRDATMLDPTPLTGRTTRNLVAPELFGRDARASACLRYFETLTGEAGSSSKKT